MDSEIRADKIWARLNELSPVEQLSVLHKLFGRYESNSSFLTLTERYIEESKLEEIYS